MTREEIIEFASRYDPQPFHLSEEAGKATHFGGLVASGWHTGSMAMRMLVDQMPEGDSGSLGSPGIDELKWTRPVVAGDVLGMRTTVLNKKESRSRPEMGLVQVLNEVLNQQGQLVMSFRSWVMVKRRPQ